MADVINRTTLKHIKSVNTPEYSPIDWIINPDLSGLQNVPKKYWKISGDNILEMTPGEKTAVDNSELSDNAKSEVLSAIEIGQTILQDYAAFNKLQIFNLNDTKDIISEFNKVTEALSLGYLLVAIDELNSINTNSSIITAGKVTELRNRIEVFLGVPLT